MNDKITETVADIKSTALNAADAKTTVIRNANDQLRKFLGATAKADEDNIAAVTVEADLMPSGFRVILAGSLGECLRGKEDATAAINIIREIYKLLAAYDNFVPDNDPHGEHDYGCFDFAFEGEDKQIMWKFEYFANGDLAHGAEDPSDLQNSYYVLSIFFSEDY
ncbi:hypothetical protein FHV99_004603 [Ochrobactrum sp. P20RRXII]|nr:DUF3768 domain-containing protein [Ochrobactrum sp. P20RRXII]NIH77351.1 hypothetical protein [Ochrobactrum sp. P20RRXII]